MLWLGIQAHGYVIHCYSVVDTFNQLLFTIRLLLIYYFATTTIQHLKFKLGFNQHTLLYWQVTYRYACILQNKKKDTHTHTKCISTIMSVEPVHLFKLMFP